jgi:hypothetical protein
MTNTCLRRLISKEASLFGAKKQQLKCIGFEGVVGSFATSLWKQSIPKQCSLVIPPVFWSYTPLFRLYFDTQRIVSCELSSTYDNTVDNSFHKHQFKANRNKIP